MVVVLEEQAENARPLDLDASATGQAKALRQEKRSQLTLAANDSSIPPFGFGVSSPSDPTMAFQPLRPCLPFQKRKISFVCFPSSFYFVHVRLFFHFLQASWLLVPPVGVLCLTTDSLPPPLSLSFFLKRERDEETYFIYCLSYKLFTSKG